MMKKIALLLIIFFVFPYTAFSITTFIIQETEKISLQANATDPDSDKLTTTYSAPLNENGEWQTTYGDAGEHKATITVTDGVTSDSKEVLVIVKKKEEPPTIDSFSPEQEFLSLKEGDSINFTISASDLNKDKLSYIWFLDGKEVQEGQEFSYEASYKDSGQHKISVIVSDGEKSVTKEFNIEVENVDLEGLLDGIKDVTVDENEIVRLELPDFEKYGLAYEISEPIGTKNEWHTTYDDAGSYNIEVEAKGKGFREYKTVKVTVNDVDRPPTFDEIGNKVVNENEELEITLNANDPDGDKIDYSANNLPEGARIQENVFTWKPSYDVVKKEGFVDWMMDKFRVLSKSFYIQFIASANDKKLVQNIIVTVKDVNRPPVIEDIPPITINEGETVKITPNIYDSDRDKITISYSGFMSSDAFKSGFDDAGTYYAKVTASDGLLETSKFVQINISHVNRAPVFEKISEIKFNEGDEIATLLNAYDPDGDGITYSIDNPPGGSSLKGNAFLWTPGFDVADKGEAKNFDLVFVASDGRAETRQVGKVQVTDKNRLPKIIDATKSIIANVNKPVLMFVKAIDEDGDELTYTWDFGLLEKYKATATHQRTFTSKGTKVIKVIVSDGTNEVEQVINVNVV